MIFGRDIDITWDLAYVESSFLTFPDLSLSCSGISLEGLHGMENSVISPSFSALKDQMMRQDYALIVLHTCHDHVAYWPLVVCVPRLTLCILFVCVFISQISAWSWQQS